MDDFMGELLVELKRLNIIANRMDERLTKIEEFLKMTNINNRDSTNQLLQDNNIEITNNNKSMQDIWNKTLEIIKGCLNEIGYNTWIKEIHPICINENQITLSTNNEFTKSILENRYSELIVKAMKDAVGKSYKINFVVQNVNKMETNKNIEYKLSNFNPQFTFGNFIVGENNKAIYEYALKFSDIRIGSPKMMYIYGGIGNGKTHMIQAMANYILSSNSSIKITYMAMDTFTKELIIAIKESDSNALTKKLLLNDVLIFDDLQSIAGKERTQEEFIRIVKELNCLGKKIILASTMPPNEYLILNQRTTSLIEIDGIFEINKPDIQTKIKIIKKIAETKNLSFSNDLIDAISSKADGNVRELINLVNRVVNYINLTGELDGALEFIETII